MEYRSGQLVASNDPYIRKLLADVNYDVRLDGSIWTRRNRSGHLTSEWRPAAIRTNQDGYYEFLYGPKCNRKSLKLSRIIFAKFNGPLEPDLMVKHRDGNKANHAPENLELVPQANINLHRFRTLKHPPVKGNRKFTDAEVRAIRALRIVGWSYRQLCNRFQTSKSNISYIVNRRTFTDVFSVAVSA